MFNSLFVYRAAEPCGQIMPYPAMWAIGNISSGLRSPPMISSSGQSAANAKAPPLTNIAEIRKQTIPTLSFPILKSSLVFHVEPAIAAETAADSYMYLNSKAKMPN